MSKKLKVALISIGGMILLWFFLRAVVGCGHPLKQFVPDAPTVVSVIPADKAASVGLTAEVKAIFSKAMDPATINLSTFTLSSAGGLVNGAVTYEPSSLTATFTPSAEFSYGTTYVATLAATVKSTEDKEMGVPFSWSFNTIPLYGLIDTNFGNGGQIIGGLSTRESGVAVLTDQAGRILVAGYSEGHSVLWRFDAAGHPDTSFGNNGVVELQKIMIADSSGKCMAIDSSGKILLAGYTSALVQGTEISMTITRLLENGSIDSSFGMAGYVSTSGPVGKGAVGNALVVAPNGKIVVTGSVTTTKGNTVMALWRLRADGLPDTSFGNNGVATHGDVAGTDSYDSGTQVAISPSGNIYVLGTSVSINLNTGLHKILTLVVWGCKPDGGLDTTFNNGKGFIFSEAIGFDLLISSANKVLVSGSEISNNRRWMKVWQFNPDGSADLSFGTSGFVTGAEDSVGSSLLRDSSGLLLIGGISGGGIAVWRIYDSGSFDTGFGNNGTARFDLSTGDGGVSSMTIDSSSGIIICGNIVNGQTKNMAAWRFK